MIYNRYMLRGLLYNLSDNSPEEDGSFGETMVDSILKLKAFSEIEHYSFKDVYIEDYRGVHQIDHVFILPNGVFVIETKAIKGRIRGTESGYFWTVYYGKGNKVDFVNPLFQNKSHIEALTNTLGVMYDYQSLVVFTNNNKPKDCPPNVIGYNELKRYLLDYKSDKTLTSADMAYIKGVIEDINKDKKVLKQKHKEQIKNRKYK